MVAIGDGQALNPMKPGRQFDLARGSPFTSTSLGDLHLPFAVCLSRGHWR
ncbi:hypothetical protein AB0B21_32840 [Streptomyces rimosus]|nr:hypothetical protein [Streptomyces rimosus]